MSLIRVTHSRDSFTGLVRVEGVPKLLFMSYRRDTYDRSFGSDFPNAEISRESKNILAAILFLANYPYDLIPLIPDP